MPCMGDSYLIWLGACPSLVRNFLYLRMSTFTQLAKLAPRIVPHASFLQMEATLTEQLVAAAQVHADDMARVVRFFELALEQVGCVGF